MAISQKESKKRSIKQRLNKGLCTRCGKPLDRKGWTCISCLEKKREDNRKDREYYIKNHVCPRCRKEKLYGDETICISCTRKEYEYTMKSRERLGRDHYNKVHREWAKVRYQQNVENGICNRCGKRKADGGYRTCGVCREKQREYKRIKYQEKVKVPRDERVKNGLCFFCDNPQKDGYKVCEKHYQMNVEKSRAQKEKPWKRSWC